MPYPIPGSLGYMMGFSSITATGRVTGAGFTSSIAGTVTTPMLNYSGDPDNGPYWSGAADRFEWSAAGVDCISLRSGQFVAYGATSLSATVGITGVVTLGALSYLVLTETTAPGAAAADTVRLYAVVDGGSKTDLAAIFQSGAVQTPAQEP